MPGVSSVLAAALLVAVLAAFAWIGLRARRSRTSLDDYLTARHSQPATALGLSFLASGAGAWILFAPPEVGAFVGPLGIAGYAVGAGAPFLVYGLAGPRLRRLAPKGHGLTTFLHARYGPAFHAYAVALSVLYMLTFVTAELTAAGSVTALLSGVPAWVAVALVAGTTLLYTASGGLRASLRTDRWQAVVLVVLLLAAAFAGASALPDAPEPRGAQLGGWHAAITLVIAVTAANLFHQGYWQRVWSAASDRALVRGGLWGALVSVLVIAVTGTLGLLAAGAGLPLGEPPAPLFALFGAGPGWLGPVVLVLAITLVASSVDTLESGLAALVGSERPTLSLGAARWLTVALMVPAIAVALQGYSVLRILLVADLLCATAVVPALAGLGTRLTGAGALAAALAGVAGGVGGALVQDGTLLAVTFPGGVPTLGPFLGALLASAAVVAGGAVFSSRRTDPAAAGARVTPLETG
ncbi:Na+/proline symporter [Limimonas halophila]|uniref:Na+/proline symporter n=1 Tax=Limimonas halophila TaxID=1082479 RepID=A0A1G7NUJ6_9PROT|nr:sodium:solute symporter [Limimonas halophila]SDF77716.1 Na+/proline symporter [Limimonas halophila]